MRGRIVRVVTDDRNQLQGLLFEHQKFEKVIIHFHGIWGNFYENPFIDRFSDFYPSHGFSFLSVNSQFHDGGSLFGRFETCILDILAWIKFAIDNGYKKIVLQGHSLGAQQVIYYLSKVKPEKELAGVILLSPVDNIALYCKNNISERDKILDIVKSIAQKDPRGLIPNEIFDQWALSAGTFLNIFDYQTESDIFPFRLGSLDGTAISKVLLPVFVAVGENDFTVYSTANDQVRLLNKFKNISAQIIHNGLHNFAGEEDQLLKKIAPWLRKNFGWKIKDLFG